MSLGIETGRRSRECVYQHIETGFEKKERNEENVSKKAKEGVRLGIDAREKEEKEDSDEKKEMVRSVTVRERHSKVGKGTAKCKKEGERRTNRGSDLQFVKKWEKTYFVGGETPRLMSVFILIFFVPWVVSSSLSDFWISRAVTFSNPTGSPLGPTQAEIVFDSAALIPLKMRSDCTDLFFLPSGAPIVNASQWRLDYFIESGCEHEKTVVWIELPSLPAEGTTISMHYGAEASWTNNPTETGSLAFHGRIVVPSIETSDDLCPGSPHWDEAVEGIVHGSSDRLVGFVESAGLFGDTGGYSYHRHDDRPMGGEISLDAGTEADPGGPTQISTVSGTSYVVPASHNHGMFYDIDGNNNPGGNLNSLQSVNAVFDVRLCEMEGTSGSHMTVPGLLPGLVVLFDDEDSYNDVEIDTELFHFDNANEKFMKIETGSFSNPSLGSPVSGIAGHSHSFTGNGWHQPAGCVLVNTGSVTVTYMNHYHRRSLVSTSGDSLPPCTWVGAAMVNGSLPEPQPFPFGSIVMATEVPPLGWETVSGWQLMPRITNVPSLVGDDTGCGSATHSHTLTLPASGDSSTASESRTASPGTDMWVATVNHYHHRTTTTSFWDTTSVPDEHIPRHVLFKYIRRNRKVDVPPVVAIGPEVMSYWTCYGIDSQDERVCNSKSGNCDSFDNCTCLDETVYGTSCEETITGLGSFRKSTEFCVEFAVSLLLLENYVTADLSISCSDVIESVGHTAYETCRFDVEGVWTKELCVTTTESFKADAPSLSEVHVHPLTDPMASVAVKLSPSVLVIDEETMKLVIAVSGAVVGVIAGVLILIGLVVTCVCIVTCANRKKLTALNRLDDVDIVLQEQAVRKHDEASGSVFHRMNVNKKLFVVEYSDLELVRELGSGGSNSIVYLARWKGMDVAFKMFNVAKLADSDTFVEEFEKEASILASVHHPFVTRFYGAAVNLPRVGVVLEYCSNGDLEEFLKTHRKYPLKERKRMVIEIASAMEYLHSLSVMHRDLKTSNVMVTKSQETRVSDFGLSRVLRDDFGNSDRGAMTVRVGTASYMAPECITGDEYGEPVDVFSFGILAYEVLTSDFRWYGKESNPQYRLVADPHFRPSVGNPELQEAIGFQLHSLMRQCWSHHPSDRPTFAEIIKLEDSIRSADASPVVFSEIDQSQIESFQDQLIAKCESILARVASPSRRRAPGPPRPPRPRGSASKNDSDLLDWKPPSHRKSELRASSDALDWRPPSSKKKIPPPPASPPNPKGLRGSMPQSRRAAPIPRPPPSASKVRPPGPRVPSRPASNSRPPAAEIRPPSSFSCQLPSRSPPTTSPPRRPQRPPRNSFSGAVPHLPAQAPPPPPVAPPPPATRSLRLPRPAPPPPVRPPSVASTSLRRSSSANSFVRTPPPSMQGGV